MTWLRTFFHLKISACAGFLSLGVLFPHSGAVGLSNSEIFLSDPDTGLAIYGYDPVAFFADSVLRPGLRSHEVQWQNLAWRFANEGNRAAFENHPHVYAPKFGGFGAMSIARGAAAEGNPHHWAIYQQRLYLFFSASNRLAWLSNPQRFVERAEENWPSVERFVVR